MDRRELDSASRAPRASAGKRSIRAAKALALASFGAGQAGKREASNDVLRASLDAAGWPVVGYYQMD